MITANRVPDHATVARFVRRHQEALGDLFTVVVELCGKAGLVEAGIVAVDGTKLRGNASREQSVDYGQIAREIIAGAIVIDEAEDQEHGEARGDELPPELSTEDGRRAWLARELAARRAAAGQPEPEQEQPEEGDEFDAERIVARVQGRQGWLREANRQLDQQRWLESRRVSRSREQRLWEAGRRLEEDLAAEVRGNSAYEAYRAQGRMKDGRRFGAPPKPYQPPATPTGTVNLSDPDTHLMKGHKVFVQGYNAQTVVTENQIVLAAEISTEPGDCSNLRPMITATQRELERASIAHTPQIALADTGYWNEQHMDDVAAQGITVLIPPDSGKRQGERPGWTGGRYTWMRRVLATDLGDKFYRKRRQTIEPVFGHTKHNRKFTQLHRRGRAAARTEWRLLMITHNLTKLYNHQIATAAP